MPRQLRAVLAGGFKVMANRCIYSVINQAQDLLCYMQYHSESTEHCLFVLENTCYTTLSSTQMLLSEQRHADTCLTNASCREPHPLSYRLNKAFFVT